MRKLLQFICSIILIAASQFSFAQDHVVVHTVEEGQTLYSISKLYQVTAAEIKEHNPLIDESYTIKPGQILWIKLKSEDQIEPVLSEMNKRPIVHIVQRKETLYGITKGYTVDIDKVREWNNLEDSKISIGQELIVGWRYRNQRGNTPKPIMPVVQIKEEAPVSVGSPLSSTSESVNQTNSTSAPVQTYAPVTEQPNRLTGKQQLLEQRFYAETATQTLETKAGPTIWFTTDNKMMSARYYALFSDAPIGSVVKVTNLINQRIVYVKVIGGLPNTAENHGAMMKMTPAAKEVLGIKDAKIRVEVTYLPHAN